MFETTLIPVRDGEDLASIVRKPKNPSCQLPTIFVFTPYDMMNAQDLWFSNQGNNPLFDSMDYAFVLADWRGRYANDHLEAGNTEQQGADGYDIVEWIAQQPFSDGHVGMYGTSAVGGVQFSIAEDQPPHLSAIVPIFTSPVDRFEKWSPGGVLRREYVDALGILYSDVVDQLAKHPYEDDTWDYLEWVYYRPELIEVPVLHVHGFFDLSAGHTLEGSKRLTSVNDKYLLIGEWHHFSSGGESDWGATMTRQELQWWDKDNVIQSNALAFYDRYLRFIPSEADDWSHVRYQRQTDWLDAETWPPKGGDALTFYLGNGTLQESAPLSTGISFTYDPFDESLTTVGGQTLHYNYTHGPAYQDEVVARDDTVTFVTEPLEESIELAGPVTVSLQASTTGTDTHFYIRFTDVDEAGHHLLLTDGARRMSLYQGVDTLSEIAPNKLYTVPIETTNPLSWRFEAGHRIGLIVNSHHWERFERSTNVEGHYLFDKSVAVEATNTIVLGESTLTLMLAPE